MRIAQVAPLYESVPPKLCGGTERVVSSLTEALTAHGHDVALYASGDSVTSARLVACAPQALRLDPSCREGLAYHHVMLEQLARDRDRYDIIHFHTDHLHLGLARHLGLRCLTTLHERVDPPELAALLYREFMDAPVVASSYDQRAHLPGARWLGVVPHGLPAEQFPFMASSNGYLAYLGRIAPNRGLDHAIEIATRLGVVLRVAAKVDRTDREYYLQRIAPLLHSPYVEFVGEIADREKAMFLGGARALLFPVDEPEPFGLVLIEALACGTPIIAYDRGSVPEIVSHGETGFLVENVEQAAAAVRRLPELSRERCREVFEARFTSTRMLEEYLAIYESLLKADLAVDDATPVGGRRWAKAPRIGRNSSRGSNWLASEPGF